MSTKGRNRLAKIFLVIKLENEYSGCEMKAVLGIASVQFVVFLARVCV